MPSDISVAFIFNGCINLISNQLVTLCNKPPYRLPSTSFSPNNNSWNLLDEAVIPPANPRIAPITGPPGNKNEGNKPTPCATPIPNPAAPINLVNCGSPSPPDILLNTFPKTPFINDFFSSVLKSLPNKNSWNASFLLAIEIPIPVIACNAGAPGKNKEASKPNPAPFLIAGACSL